MSIDLSQFTPTQRRIMRKLLDGCSKPRRELLGCLAESDEGMADYRTLRVHINSIRKILLPLGLDVVCINQGYMRPARYRLVRQFMYGKGNGSS